MLKSIVVFPRSTELAIIGEKTGTRHGVCYN